MDDLISRKALMKYMRDYKWEFALNSDFSKAIEMVDVQPAVEAVPVVHGEWIRVPSSDMATGRAYECSNCKKMRYGSFLPPFCQMCGADMRKKV